MQRGLQSTNRRWKGSAIIIVVLAGLDLVWNQFSSYELLAEPASAETVVGFLPQFTHFEAARFDFVCIAENTASSLSPDAARALEEVLERYFAEVYQGWDEIPEERRIYATKEMGYADSAVGTVIGLEAGCIIEWEIKKTGLFWFHARYSDWEGNLAAAQRTAVFVWVLGRWIKIWQTALVVS